MPNFQNFFFISVAYMLDTSRVNSRTISLLHPVWNCFFDGFYSSFADPGCLYRILSFSILTQILFLNSRKYDPGCSFRIRIPDPDPDILPYPGSWGLKKHRIRIRNTVLFYLTSAPDPFCSRDPSGMGEISGSGSRSGSGMNNPDHISESLEQFFGLKTT
jgi:hypothetical protein